MDVDELAKQTLQRTWDFHQRLYTLTESTIEAVRERFNPDDYDPWYFTHSIRHDICRGLDSMLGWDRTFSRIPHPLSGIELLYKEFRFKMWKSTGDMPIVGNSTGRAEFLRQPFLENYLEAFVDGDAIPLK